MYPTLLNFQCLLDISGCYLSLNIIPVLNRKNTFREVILKIQGGISENWLFLCNIAYLPCC